jgi:peptidyl-prolyl cis-trans isomerase A (cyclophilin A)
MRRAAILLALLAGCEPAAPAAAPSTPPAPPVSGDPLRNPEHPEMKKAAPASYKVRLDTDAGGMLLEVTRDWAPHAADRFYNLVRHGFYDSARFFRVVPSFVAQFGLNGDPGISGIWKNANLPDEPRKAANERGTIAFAKAGPNSRTTQVFLNFKHNATLDSPQMDFAPFGRIIVGMDVLEAINAEYGERPDQGRIQLEGNAYLTREFPRLTFILKATIAE